MQIANNIWSLDCSQRSHIYVIKTNNTYVMIDTGYPGLTPKIYEELLTYNIRAHNIKYVLLTHGDVDHVGNLQNIINTSNCEVYADNEEIPYLEKKKRYNAIKGFLKALLHIKPFQNIKPLPENEIDGIQIIKTPGHTPGHVCYKFNNYLFAGDLIGMSKGKVRLLPKLMTYDQKQLLNSINHLDVNGVEYIYPAHGDIINVHPT
jgi:glyoxylase-like metal-dependent hydrolase (beta-lactamase superfamily II)